MKKLVLILGGFLLLLPAAPARADHPSGATMRDVRVLQDELENLDQSFALLEASDPRAAEFRRREAAIRDRITVLTDQIRRHRRNQRTGLGASKATVDDLMRDIVDLQRDMSGAFATRYPSRDMMLPEGTQLQVRLEQDVSSRTARLEDQVEATVDVPVRDSNGRIAIPAGARVTGTITRVDRASRPARGAELEISFDSLYIDNQRIDMRTRLVSLDQGVDRSRTAERAGLGAVLGAVLGGLLEGKEGALVGILVGGAGGVVSSRGEEIVLPAGTIVTLQLDRALTTRRF